VILFLGYQNSAPIICLKTAANMSKFLAMVLMTKGVGSRSITTLRLTAKELPVHHEPATVTHQEPPAFYHEQTRA